MCVTHELDHDETRRTLTTADGPLHYHEAGTGPPLVLLHGSGPGVSAWANFHDNLGVFAEHFHTYALDLPGFGVSHAVEGSPVITAPAAVLAFLDALELEHSALLGNSLGGGVAARLAASHPDRVTRLVTLGGVGISLFAPTPSEGIKLLVDFVEEPTRARLVAWMESMVSAPSVLTDDLVEQRWRAASTPDALAAIRQMYNRPMLGSLRDMLLGTTMGFDHLPSIRVPTLLTWGRDDRVTPVDGALLPMRLIPRCEVHVFPDCGHWAMIERKDEFERVVLEFLTRDRIAEGMEA